MTDTASRWDPQSVREAAFKTVEDGRPSMAPSTVRVPLRSYTDPDRLRQELDEIFYRKPLPIALATEIDSPNSWVTTEILGTPLLLTRDGEGKFHAFLNSCSHRAAQIAEAPCGVGGRITCPYHGWTYDLEGRLRAVLEPRNFGEIDKSAYGLIALPAEEKHGLLWIAMTPGEELNLEAWLGEIGPMLDGCDSDEYRLYKNNKVLGCNWKAQAEGFMENYHFTTLHADTVGSYMHNNRLLVEQIGHHLRIVNPHKDGTHTVAFYLFPNLMYAFNLEHEFVSSQQMWPIVGDPQKSDMWCRYATKRVPQTDAERQEIDRFVAIIQRTVNEEDVRVTDGIQRVLAAKERIGGPEAHNYFGQCESGPQYLHRQIEEMLKEA